MHLLRANLGDQVYHPTYESAHRSRTGAFCLYWIVVLTFAPFEMGLTGARAGFETNRPTAGAGAGADAGVGAGAGAALKAPGGSQCKCGKVFGSKWGHAAGCTLQRKMKAGPQEAALHLAPGALKTEQKPTLAPAAVAAAAPQNAGLTPNELRMLAELKVYKTNHSGADPPQKFVADAPADGGIKLNLGCWLKNVKDRNKKCALSVALISALDALKFARKTRSRAAGKSKEKYGDNVLDMPVVKMNKYIKDASLSEEEIADLKKARRRKKNRLYAKQSRERKTEKLDNIDALQSKVAELEKAVSPMGLAAAAAAAATQAFGQDAAVAALAAAGLAGNTSMMDTKEESTV